MVLDSVRSIVKNAFSCFKGSLSAAWFSQNKNKILNAIADLKNENSDEAARWLKDNKSFIRRSVERIETKNMLLPRFVFESLGQLAAIPNLSWSKEEWNGFFECVVSHRELSDCELNSIPSAWVLLLSQMIVKSEKSAREDIPRLITMLHRFGSSDITSLLSCYSPIERVLRRDPDGTYLRMTRESQSSYIEAIKRDARKRRMKPEALARELLDMAERDKRHIGFYLSKKKGAQWFYTVLFLVFLVLIAQFYFASKSIVLSVLIMPALYFFCQSVLEYVASKLKKAPPLPAIRTEKIDEEHKTCVVITALVTSAKDIEALCTKLLRYKINNYGTDESIRFGLLCDLKESKRETESDDESLRQMLSSTIEKLNSTSPVFFAYLRKRTYHESEASYAGWERKRGAIDQLVASFCGEDFENSFYFGSPECVTGVKYLITLDSDTELLIGQARRLVGIISHPLQRAVISSGPEGECVISGHGIIQPKITTTLFEKIATPYAKIFNNGSGEILYAGAGYDTMQSFYGEANFCGKGIIDVQTFYRLLHKRFREQTVLSHDMPEGAVLRAGLAVSEYFVDSSPQNSISHYKRMHRWIRGDVQNLSVVSMLRPTRRFLLFENLVRYLKPLFELVFLLASFLKGVKAGIAALLLVLLFHAAVFCCQLTDFVLTGRVRLLNRRFSTRMRNLVLNSLYHALISFCAIGFEAWYFTDAVIRSLYRMTVSRKKLLQWQVYESTGKNRSYLSFYFPSCLTAILFLIVRRISPLSILFAPFALLPLIYCLLDRPYEKVGGWSSSEKEKMLSFAERELRFFRECVNESTNYLPPDNVQLEPVEKVAMRTSPTNIGLYLASIAVSTEIGLMSEGEMIRRVERAFASIDKMERYQGHFFNWYDLTTLRVIGERFISTVDSGNFYACLIVTRQILIKLSDHVSCHELVGKIDNLIKQVDFRILYRREKNVFSVGLFPDEERLSDSDYDMYMSEARITGFLAIGMGQIPASHWSALSRPLLSLSGRVGVGSWSGTAFEYFMPPLFLPVIENSLEDESLDFALFCQKKYSALLSETSTVFGISESGYSLTDREQNYQYKAFGVPYLSVQGDRKDNKVISPYSSFLMLERGKREVLENLKLMEKHGFTGVYGFFEAFEFNSNFLDDYSVVRSYMSHHKGMSFLALANALSDRITVRHFLSYSYLSAKTELFAERFPIEANLTKIKPRVKDLVRSNTPKEARIYPLTDERMYGFLLTDGKLTLEAFDDGSVRLIERGKTAFRMEKCPTCLLDGIDVAAGNNVRKEIVFGETFIEFSFKGDRQLFRLRFDLLCGQSTLLIRAFLDGYSGAGDMILELSPQMCDEKSFLSHPAFHLLSMEVKNDSEGFVLRKREIDKHHYLHVKTEAPLRIVFDSKDEKCYFPFRMLSRDKIILSQGFSCYGSVTVPWLITFSDQEIPKETQFILDGSFSPSSRMRIKAASVLARLHEMCNYDEECELMESKLLTKISTKSKILCSSENPLNYDFLWKHGISGDYPLVTVFFDREDPVRVKNCEVALRVVKKLAISQIPFDLLILHEKGDGYFDAAREELTAMLTRFQCEFLLGKHPGIHFVSFSKQCELDQFSSLSVFTVGVDESPRYLRLPLLPLQIIKKHYASKEVDRVGTFEQGDFVLNKNEFFPEEPFSHVVCNDRVGFICDQNSLGYTWYRNSGLFRLSKWENIPTQDSGEKLILKLSERSYDLISFADKVRYHKGYVTYSGTVCGASFEIVSGVCRSLSAKYVMVRLDDRLVGTELTFSFVPVIGKEEGGTLLIKENNGGFVMNRSPLGAFTDGGWFHVIGSEAEMAKDGDRLCFSWDSRKENLMFLGGYSTKEHLSYVLKEIDECRITHHLRAEKHYLNELVPTSGNTKIDWIAYQSVMCRFVAKSGLYQSGGAFGFRDQLQDCLTFLGYRDDLCRRHILRSAAHQFDKGVRERSIPFRNSKSMLR